ncbi:hypothetical protein [Streptomyces sp. NPDC054834]
MPAPGLTSRLRTSGAALEGLFVDLGLQGAAAAPAPAQVAKLTHAQLGRC